MTKATSTKLINGAGLTTLLLVSPLLAFLPGCTDLTESPASSITPGNYFRTQEEVIGALAGVYAQLKNTVRDDGFYYDMSEISTDEMVVPTRGQDWYDNGRWLEIHRQKWEAGSPSGLYDINGAWVAGFAGISRANLLLDALPQAALRAGLKDTITAEARTLRAFYYYTLMDFFGGVPIVTDPEIKPRPRATRKEVFEFIEKELGEAKAFLPPQWAATDNGRMTKGAADAILASMYINAEVFTGTVTTSGLTKGTARWADAQAAADRILTAGVYSLRTGALGAADDWRSNFKASNDLDPENILVVKHKAQDGLGMNFLMRALHYNQLTPSPWNGFSTLAETYNAFDAADQRREIFLVGPQVNLETQAPVKDRTGAPLVFTTTIANVEQAKEGEGARIAKWPADPNHVGPEHGNDFAWFRLAEIYLIKAEALNEQGDFSGALTLVNTIRARVFNPPKPVAGGDVATVRNLIFQERVFEFAGEGKRRQDQIRAGTYTAANAFKGITDAYRILMPIPQQQRDANPELDQNPGY